MTPDRVRRLVLLLAMAAALALAGCEALPGSLVADEPGQLIVSIDSRGDIALKTDTGADPPPALGRRQTGEIVDPTRYYQVKSTLTVRLGDREYFYDLEGGGV